MFTRKHPTRSRSLKLAAGLAPALVATIVLGMTSLPAGAAITIGPSSHGQMSGTAYCNAVTHQIGVTYSVSPEYSEYTTSLSSILATMQVQPEYVEVYVYAKLSSSSNWGTPIADGYAYVDRPMTLINTLRSAYADQYYDIGFFARAAFPNGTWTSWIWDRPTVFTSFSGSTYANYGYCRT